MGGRKQLFLETKGDAAHMNAKFPTLTSQKQTFAVRQSRISSLFATPVRALSHPMRRHLSIPNLLSFCLDPTQVFLVQCCSRYIFQQRTHVHH